MVNATLITKNMYLNISNTSKKSPIKLCEVNNSH